MESCFLGQEFDGRVFFLERVEFSFFTGEGRGIGWERILRSLY